MLISASCFTLLFTLICRYAFALQNRFVKRYDAKLVDAQRFEVPLLSLSRMLKNLIFTSQGEVLFLASAWEFILVSNMLFMVFEK